MIKTSNRVLSLVVSMVLFYIREFHIYIYKKSTRLFTVVEPVRIDNRQNIRIGFVMTCILPANVSACLSP